MTAARWEETVQRICKEAEMVESSTICGNAQKQGEGEGTTRMTKGLMEEEEEMLSSNPLMRGILCQEDEDRWTS